MISPFLFYAMAFVVVFSGLMMVASKNLVHSAVYMVFCFLGVSGIYASMHLSFFAIVQILVYVGAITTLLIFGIMLTRHPNDDMEETNGFSNNLFGASAVAIGTAVVMSIVVRTLKYIEPRDLPSTYIQDIGVNLFGVYVLPVEMVAILLLVGMLGAVMIGKEADDQ